MNAVPSTDSKKDKMRNVTITVHAPGATVNSRNMNAVPSTDSKKDKMRNWKTYRSTPGHHDTPVVAVFTYQLVFYPKVNSLFIIVDCHRLAASMFQWQSDGNSPPSDCFVLIAGTNDVAAGDQRNIYGHLEERIVSKPPEGRLIVATLPHRHDLPVNHAINEEVVLVNAYIEELAIRHNIQVLNKTSQRYFTRHGLHLTMKGKWLLAKVIVKALYKVGHDGVDRTRCRHSPPSTQEGPSGELNTAPLSLPHDTYAGTVKSPRRRNEGDVDSSDCCPMETEGNLLLVAPLLTPPRISTAATRRQ
ncbi:hypothetical protein J6590_062593 [Homalodisca vitripennis]|nr:hypothetical protein J6590_062593 [Homalodisca vitripennis]